MKVNDLTDARTLAKHLFKGEVLPRVVILVHDLEHKNRVRSMACEAAKMGIFHASSPFESGVFRILITDKNFEKRDTLLIIPISYHNM